MSREFNQIRTVELTTEQLRNVFCVALADIRDSWGKKDEPSKD